MQGHKFFVGVIKRVKTAFFRPPEMHPFFGCFWPLWKGPARSPFFGVLKPIFCVACPIKLFFM